MPKSPLLCCATLSSSVQITQVNGRLTDHYNPADRTVNLSYDVYHGQSVAAAAVAAHECGHAVQHAHAYPFLTMRSQLVPVVQIASSLQQYLFMFGLAGIGMFHNKIFLIIALVAFGITALFSLITLPVEFDASRRALVWLDESGFARGAEYSGAKDALTWAAMTYVSAAMAALVQFVYLLIACWGAGINLVEPNSPKQKRRHDPGRVAAFLGKKLHHRLSRAARFAHADQRHTTQYRTSSLAASQPLVRARQKAGPLSRRRVRPSSAIWRMSHPGNFSCKKLCISGLCAPPPLR